MALKSITQVTKEEFVKGSNNKVLASPRTPRAKKLSDRESRAYKILLFGKQGSGKTLSIVGLLLHGFKVFVISTDMGGDGLETVEMELGRLGRLELFDNVIHVTLPTYDNVMNFLDNPQSVYPEIYTEGIDWLFWDGFSGYQQINLAEEIGSMTPAKSGDKEVSDARESGLQFEMQDWGMVRNGTIRPLSKFIALNNAVTGQVWHKIVTCLEGTRVVRSGSGINITTSYVDTKEPLIQGAACKLLGPAFDLIINTRIGAGEEKEKRKYLYVCAGHESVDGPKTRGLELPPIFDADMYKLWEEIVKQKGIKKGELVNDFSSH